MKRAGKDQPTLETYESLVSCFSFLLVLLPSLFIFSNECCCFIGPLRLFLVDTKNVQFYKVYYSIN